MTAIHRRAMLGIMLGGAAVATMGLTVNAGPSRIRAINNGRGPCCGDRKSRREGGMGEASRPGVLVAQGTSSVPLAPCAPLAPRAPLLVKARPVGGD